MVFGLVLLDIKTTSFMHLFCYIKPVVKHPDSIHTLDNEFFPMLSKSQENSISHQSLQMRISQLLKRLHTTEEGKQPGTISRKVRGRKKT